MSSAVCPACSADEVHPDEANGCMVCHACGTVTEEILSLDLPVGADESGQYVSNDDYTNYRKVVSLGPNHGTLRLDSSLSRAQYLATVAIMNVARTFQLSKTQIKEVRQLFAQIRKTGPFGGTIQAIGAVCVYTVSRLHGKPITLLEIADNLRLNVFTLQRTFLRLKRHLKLSLPDVDPANVVEDLVAKVEDASSDKYRQVCKYAIRLVELARDKWIASGRRPLPVVIAAIDVTYQILEQVPNAPSRHLKQLCAQIGTGEATAKARAKEIKAHVLEIAKPMPWMRNMSDANVLASSKFVLENLNFCRKMHSSRPEQTAHSSSSSLLSLAGASSVPLLYAGLSPEPSVDTESTAAPDTLPPSFVKAAEARKERLAKVQAAKARLVRLCLLPDRGSVLPAEFRSLNSTPVAEGARKTTASSLAVEGEPSPLAGPGKAFFTPISEAQQGDSEQLPPVSPAKAPVDSLDDDAVEDLDELDLLIEKLLLHGVPESIIEQGTVSKLESISDGLRIYNGEIRSDDNLGDQGELEATSATLTERDLPDNALAEYIRSSDEIELLAGRRKRAADAETEQAADDSESDHEASREGLHVAKRARG